MHLSGRRHKMRTSQMIVTVATHTGWSLEYIGRLSYRQVVYLVNNIDYQQRCEAYRIEYRIGQIICTLAGDKLHKYKPEQFVGDAPERMEVSINMTEETRTQSVVLGDGRTYQLPSLDANIMEAIEEEFDQSWQELFAEPRTKILKALVYHLLKSSDPNITREEVGALLTIKAQNNISKVIAKLV